MIKVSAAVITAACRRSVTFAAPPSGRVPAVGDRDAELEYLAVARGRDQQAPDRRYRRSDGDEIALTHRFMAMMIAAERSGVTVSLHVLEGAGMIRSKRGRVEILDRAKLEDLAGDGYGRPEAEYRRLIGPFGGGPPGLG